jgi:type IV secretion system protein VirB1
MDFQAVLPVCAPDIHPVTMLKMLKTESSGNPLAININGGVRLAWQPRSLPEAIVTARDLRRRGLNFDAGPWQINTKNWHWLGLNEITVFDPCESARAAQRVLLDCFTRAPATDPQVALRLALSCYNSGSFRNGFSSGYVRKVLRAPVAVPSVLAAKEDPP